MKPWEHIARAQAPDGNPLELRKRGHEYLILAGGRDLMSSEDERSSRALAELGCARITRSAAARVLVGGLGMGYTLRAALDAMGPNAVVEIAELSTAVVEWNRNHLGSLAGHPLDDPRVALRLGDVRAAIRQAQHHYDAILLDVDNGPSALVHAGNDSLYQRAGLREAWDALKPGGALGVWSFADEQRFTRRLQHQGFGVDVHHVDASRRGRGRRHVIWIARTALTDR